MTAVKIAVFVCLILLGLGVLDSAVPDTATLIIVLPLLGGGFMGIGHTFGYSVGAFDASQFLKEKYVLTDKE